MFNARTVKISLDHIVAEMLAFPFVSPEALNSPVERLCPQLTGRTRELWRSAERHFVAHFPHASLDELVALRNWSWFGAANQSEAPLHRYLRHIAARFFTNRGAYAEPKLPGPGDGESRLLERSVDAESHDPAARRAWRWLTFAIPWDLLLAGLARDGSGPVRVNLLCPPVAALLQAGYAETHLHYGIALDFPTVWASAVNVVARGPAFRWNMFDSPGAEHEEGNELASWLVRAAIVRYFLGAYLAVGRSHSCLYDFLFGNAPDSVFRLLKSLSWSGLRIDALVAAVEDLSRGELGFDHVVVGDIKRSFVELQSAYNALTGASWRPHPRSLDEVQSLDPLATFYTVREFTGPSIQLQFLWQGLDYLERQCDPTDDLFARLFWQVERVRGQAYRHCIQRPLTPGLMHFIRFYERKGKFTTPIDEIALESAGVLGGVGHGLASLEVRTSPQSNRDDQLKSLKELRGQWRRIQSEQTRAGRCRDGSSRASGWQHAECGVVLHFLKRRGDRSDKGLPHAFDAGNFADPSASRSCYRWGNYFILQRRQAWAIANAVRQDARALPSAPSILRFLRGIDVCRDEHGVPTWVVAPLFHLVRLEVRDICQRYREKHSVELPPLRTTAHVGEDFVHLITGLRYMDEAIEHLPLESGDRAGHGLALGIEPQEWATRFTRLAMPREDRWLDLIWERRWHAQPGARFATDRRAFVEDEIARLSRNIFWTNGSEPDNALSPADAVEFVDLLYDWKTLEELGFPNRMLSAQPPAGVRRLLERYLTEPAVYRNGRTVEWVQTYSEGDAISELQRLVRSRYARAGITIEVNPISNLLVGDLTDLETHPLWRLAPGLRDDDGLTLRLCIGSDDPLPFATTLPDEYQFLYDSLVLAGRSHAEARSWLEEIRKMGWESRFTLPVP